MNITAEQLRLYAVTDRAWVGKLTLPQQVEAALKGGVTCVQLREKQLDEGDFFNEALEIQKICRYYHVPFLLNDNVPLALRCGADGVHVGQDDMSAKEARRILGADKIIGVSAHDPDEAKKAYADGADYLGCAVYATPTKGDAARCFPLPPRRMFRCGAGKRWLRSARLFPSRWSPSAASTSRTCSLWPAVEKPVSPSSVRFSPPRTSNRSAGNCASLSKSFKGCFNGMHMRCKSRLRDIREV